MRQEAVLCGKRRGRERKEEGGGKKGGGRLGAQGGRWGLGEAARRRQDGGLGLEEVAGGSRKPNSTVGERGRLEAVGERWIGGSKR